MDSDDELPPLLVDTRERPENNATNGESQDVEPTPVTIVTGYLGSGKSTLLQRLAKITDKKIAVVLNEFGQTSDIERSLTIQNQAEDGTEVEDWVELDNGCMCCTAKDAGVTAIERLMERKGRFDYVIIETSGLADPAPIANMFWLDDALMARVKLDGVVTVVDARTISRSLDEGDLANVQIACADVVLVNKTDTVDETELSRVESRVAQINGAARTLRTSYGNVPAEAILDLKAYSTISFDDLHLNPAPESDLSNDVHDHPHGHDGANQRDPGRSLKRGLMAYTKGPNHGLSTVVIPLEPILSARQIAEFETNLQHILWSKEVGGHAFEVHRAKGRLTIEPGTSQAATKIVQGVRETYEIITVPYEPTAESKIVLIGRALEPIRAELTRMLNPPRSENGQTHSAT